MEITANAIETFFSDFGNSEIMWDGQCDVLTEIAQGNSIGFFWEALEINDGAFYVLEIAAHRDMELAMEERTRPHADLIEGTTHYRFETLQALKEALARFMLASISSAL